MKSARTSPKIGLFSLESVFPILLRLVAGLPDLLFAKVQIKSRKEKNSKTRAKKVSAIFSKFISSYKVV